MQTLVHFGEEDAPRPYVAFEYTCRLCYRTFKSGHALGGHQNAHRNDRNRVAGTYCGVTYGFENRIRLHRVAASKQNNQQRPIRVQRQGVFGGSGHGLNRLGGGLQLALGLGPVAHDCILGMARPRLNKQGPLSPLRVAPPLLYPDNLGGETRAMYYVENMPGFRFNQGLHPALPVQPGFGVDVPRIGVGSGGLRPTWAMPGAGLNPQGARAEPWSASVVGDNFSDLHLGNGFSDYCNGNDTPSGVKPIGAPTMEESLILSIAAPAVAPRFYHSYHPPGPTEPPLGGFLEGDLERWKPPNGPNSRADIVMSSLNIGVEGSFDQAMGEVDLRFEALRFKVSSLFFC